MSTTTKPAWWARWILIGSLVAACLLPLGALGTRFGLWPFTVGFLIAGVGILVAAIGFVLAFVALIVAFRRRLLAERLPIGMGLVICLLTLTVVGVQVNMARSAPPIHNVTTDVDDPPQMSALAAVRGEHSNPWAFDRDRAASLQRRAYPWLKSIETDLDPAAAFRRASDVVSQMGWKLVSADPQSGVIEATDTTFWFGFKDDVVIRIRPMAHGCRVDLHSVSRVGVGDAGTNARRIGEFMHQFEG